METREIIEKLENEINKTSGEWVEIYEEKVFFQNIIALLKQEEEEPKRMNILTVKTDGSCMPNPGDMGIGVVIYKGSKIVKTVSQYIGYGTNNEAEYVAFIRGLVEAKRIRKSGDEIRVFIDSELVYMQIKGAYRVKKEGLKPLCKRGKELIQEIGNIQLMWNRRIRNEEADILAKKAILLKLANIERRGEEGCKD